MNDGREWEIAEAQVKASSKVDLRRKPPKIMKLWRLRYWGCIIWTDWTTVEDIQRAFSGFLAGVLGSSDHQLTLWEGDDDWKYHGNPVVEAREHGSGLILRH